MSGQQVTAPTRAEFRTLKDCKSLGDAFQCAEFMERIKASAPSHIKPARMLRTFVQATSKAPLLLQCTMRSVLGAMLTCSEVGLEPNTPLQHAFLIPFGKYKWNKAKRERELVGYEVQLIFGYPGLLDLSYRSGQVTSVHAGVAYKDEYDNGRFSFEYGTNAHLTHRPERARPDEEVPSYAYAHASLTAGQAFEVMPWPDVLKIRNGSQGFRSALAAKEAAEKNNWRLPATWTEAPWVKHERRMGGKTVFRALSTWLPRSVELAGVLALDETQDRGTVDFGQVIDGEVSIVEGGFQEGEPLVEDEPENNATATFGLRAVGGQDVDVREEQQTAEPEKAKPTPKPRAAKPAPVSEPEPEPQTKPEPEPQGPVVTLGEPGFSAWLVNGDGEPIEDEDGTAERFTDPVAYARALANTLESAFPADRALIHAANADDAAEAGRISKEALLILAPKPPAGFTDPIVDARIEQPPPVEEARAVPQTDPWQIPPPAQGNKAEWERFNGRLETLLASATNPDALTRIIELNNPVYNEFAPKYRTAAKALIEARQNALTVKPSGAPTTKSPPTFDEIYAALMADVAACQSEKDLKSLESNTAVVRRLGTLKAGAPELCDRVQQAAKAKLQELHQAAGG